MSNPSNQASKDSQIDAVPAPELVAQQALGAAGVGRRVAPLHILFSKLTVRSTGALGFLFRFRALNPRLLPVLEWSC